MRAIHHKWESMPQDHPIPLIARRRLMGEHVMIAEVRLDKGFKVPTHNHDNEQFAVVLSGHMLFGIHQPDSPEYYEVEVVPGEVLHLMANVPHSAEALEDSVLFDIFSPASEIMGVDMVGRPH
jgi:quercetin dioxygenase-like cupin family protein